MIFTRIAAVVATIGVAFGIFLVLGGLSYATGLLAPEGHTPNSGKLIDQGTYLFAASLVFGVLSEISKSLQRKD